MELQILDKQKLSKTEITNKAKIVIENAREGYINPLELKILCKSYMEYFKKIDSEITNIAMEEAEKYIKDNKEYMGVKFELSNTGNRLDYEADSIYKELKQNLKEREALLKLAYQSKDSIFDNKGEEVSKVPVKLHSKSIIKISL